MDQLETDFLAMLAACQSAAETAAAPFVAKLEADLFAMIPLLDVYKKGVVEAYKAAGPKGTILSSLLALLQVVLAAAPQLAASIEALIALFGGTVTPAA